MLQAAQEQQGKMNRQNFNDLKLLVYNHSCVPTLSCMYAWERRLAVKWT